MLKLSISIAFIYLIVLILVLIRLQRLEINRTSVDHRLKFVVDFAKKAWFPIGPLIGVVLGHFIATESELVRRRQETRAELSGLEWKLRADYSRFYVAMIFTKAGRAMVEQSPSQKNSTAYLADADKNWNIASKAEERAVETLGQMKTVAMRANILWPQIQSVGTAANTLLNQEILLTPNPPTGDVFAVERWRKNETSEANVNKVIDEKYGADILRLKQAIESQLKD